MHMNAKKKILLIDDDCAFVQANRDLLEAYNYKVFSAQNGADGLELAKREHPDMIILDVMMATDTEGFEIARRLFQLPELKGVRVILVTGINKALNLPYKFEADEAWLPVSHVLEKPIPPKVLLAEIEKLLAAKAQQ